MKKLLMALALTLCASASMAQYPSPYVAQKSATEKNPPDLSLTLVDYTTSQPAATVLSAPCGAVGPPSWQALCAETMNAWGGGLSTVTAIATDHVLIIDASDNLFHLALASDLISAGGAPADDSVTFAKMQEITTDRLIGRDTAGTGNPEEISVGGGLEFTGTAAIQSSAYTGDVTKAAGGTATTIANNAVTTAHILDGNVTLAKMANIATNSLIGRDTALTGVPEAILLDDSLEMDGAGNLQRAALTGDVTSAAGSNALSIPINSVTYDKLPNLSTNTLIGRDTAGTGDPEEVALDDTSIALTGDLRVKDTFVSQRTEKVTPTSADFVLISDAAASDVNKKASVTSVVAAGTANDSVSYAKIQNVSASDRLLGRVSASAGDIEEIEITDYVQTILNDADAATARTTLGFGTASAMLTQTVRLTGNLTRTANTQADAAGLAVSMTSGHTYNVNCSIVFTSSSPTSGLSLGATWGAMTAAAAFAEIGVSISSVLHGNLAASGDARTGTDTPSQGFAKIHGTFVPSADGTFQVQYSPETNGVTATLWAGSNCTWTDVP